MKAYKIQPQNIVGLSAEIVEKLDGIINVYADESFSYILSNQELPTPFVEVIEMPSEVKIAYDALLNERKQAILDQALETTKQITSFTSSVLGSPHIYDLAEQDQINLSQAREYIDLMVNAQVYIRCTDESGIKDNVLHTKDQVNTLFSDWYVKKSLILNTNSKLKLLIGSAKSFEEVEEFRNQFNEAIERITNG